MADKIKIDTEVLEELRLQINQIRTSLTDIAGDVSSSVAEVRRVASEQTGIINRLERARKNTNTTADHAGRFARAVQRSTQLWEKTERSITENKLGTSESPFGHAEGDTASSQGGNAVFDPSASGRKKFGGDQGAPRNDIDNYDKYRDIIEKNTGKKFKKNSDLRRYLQKLNNEGCGYVAMINTIFAAYEGRPEEFRKTFGYDMYDENGNPNYNMLLVDIYSATDNRNADGSFNKYEDFKWGLIFGDGWKMFYDPWTDTTGAGTSIQAREEKIQYFLNSHNVDCEVQTYPKKTLTADQYNRMVADGTVKQGQLHIRVGGDPVIMRDANGNKVHTYSGGHAMTVTGTTESGMLQVSSWGETYYIDPSDLGKNTSMGYQIVHIQS